MFNDRFSKSINYGGDPSGDAWGNVIFLKERAKREGKVREGEGGEGRGVRAEVSSIRAQV